MMCSSCSRLAFLYTKKICIRCQGEVAVNIAVICEICSIKNKICSVCSKKIQNQPPRTGGCGCGKK